jgi:hypothetical protein
LGYKTITSTILFSLTIAHNAYLAGGDAVFRLSIGKPEKNPVDPVYPVK